MKRHFAAGCFVALAFIACSAKEQTFDTKVELLRLRPIRRDVADPSVILTMDVEVSYFECPGEQRKSVRGDKAFSMCMAKHTIGEKVPIKLDLTYDAVTGLYKNRITRIADCERKLDPNDEASFEVVQDCEDLQVNGVMVGVHCDRTRSKELLAKCPWFRVR